MPSYSHFSQLCTAAQLSQQYMGKTSDPVSLVNITTPPLPLPWEGLSPLPLREILLSVYLQLLFIKYIHLTRGLPQTVHSWYCFLKGKFIVSKAVYFIYSKSLPSGLCNHNLEWLLIFFKA